MSNWEWKKLGDVAQIYNGNSINAKVKKDKYSNIDDGYPFIATKDVGFDSVVDYDNGIKIPFSEKGFKIAPKNAVLICAEGGSAGRKKCLLEEDVCFGNKLFAIVGDEKYICGKYIFYYTFEDSFLKEFKKLLAGIIGGISNKKFKEILIPIPPLAEQKRIVKTLDEKFAKIDKLKTAAETNLKNTREIYNAELEKIFLKNAVWNTVRLSDVCAVGSSKRIYAEEQTLTGIPFLRVSDLVEKMQGIEKNDLYISKEKFEDLKEKGLVPRENDILVTSRGTLGLCYIVKENDNFYFQDGMITWLAPNGKTNSKFIVYLFESKIVKEQIKDKSAGAAVSYISITDIRNFQIPLPPLSEQKRIVAHLDKLSEKVKRLEEIYRRTIADCEELKKSILKQVFEVET